MVSPDLKYLDVHSVENLSENSIMKMAVRKKNIGKTYWYDVPGAYPLLLATQSKFVII